MAANKPGDISESTFLTVAEVATMMRVSKMTVYRLVHSGELPAVRVGRSFRVREEDANDYIRNSFELQALIEWRLKSPPNCILM